MNNRRVVIIAMDQPLDSDAQLRGKMENVDRRAERQSPGFGELDLHAVQQEVNRNLLKLPLLFRGRYMGLPDLMNYVRNGCRFPEITPRNASQHYLFANGFTLNGIYLYQYLQRNGYDPEVVQNYSLADLTEVLGERPLAVCISSTFLYLDDIREMAARIKAVDPEIPVIVGGILVKKIMDAGAQMAPQTLKWLSGFRGLIDFFVIETHGEQTLLKVLEVLKGGDARDPADVPNLAFYDSEGRLSFTRREEEDLPMDETAIAWDRIPRQYLRKTLSVVTSQGCHYRCRFCTYHRWFPKVRNKSLSTLRDELRRIRDLGFVRHVRFADDNFTADPRRLKSVLEMMIRERFDFTWSAFARANTLTAEMVKRMQASGCEFLNMGIESGSREILRSMDKRLDPEETVKAIRLLKEHGIYSLGGIIVGYPGETADTFEETVDLINRSGLNYYHPYLFYYSKSMLVHREKERFGIRGVGWAWRHATMDAVEASRLMAGMIRRVERAYTDGQQKTWETFKLLRGEGYSGEEILELHRLKRDLQTALSPSEKGEEETPEIKAILDRIRGIMIRPDLPVRC
ncbi:MAG: radical SAM protein [Deltaproteobacteria bacterium]|nr:radical SAM protein [Deltaproteobacteria bacterium]